MRGRVTLAIYKPAKKTLHCTFWLILLIQHKGIRTSINYDTTFMSLNCHLKIFEEKPTASPRCYEKLKRGQNLQCHTSHWLALHLGLLKLMKLSLLWNAKEFSSPFDWWVLVLSFHNLSWGLTRFRSVLDVKLIKFHKVALSRNALVLKGIRASVTILTEMP